MLLLVIGAVVLPLTLVGVWLARSAQRAATLLVQSQLDSIVIHAAGTVADRWADAASDVRLLAENEPVSDSINGPASQPMPHYVEDAFATMPEISNVVFFDADGRVRWTSQNAQPVGAVGRAPASFGLIVRAASVRGADGSQAGSVVARVSPSWLFAPESPRAPAQAFVALLDRSSASWTGAFPMPASLLSLPAFTWSAQRWLVSRRAMQVPHVTIVAAAPLDPVAEPFARTATQGIAALAAVCLLVILLSVFGARRLTAPLGSLAIAADAVARGDFGLAIAPTGPSEVARLGQAFDAMRTNLRAMMDERSQREALAALGELSATIAHQVRTPLTAIRLDLQRVQEMVPGEAADLVAHALAGARRIEEAVAASLSIARSGAAKFESVAVTDLIREAAAAVGPRAAARGISLHLGDDREICLVRGDRIALGQAITNVLMNATEAARNEVRVSVRGGERVMIEIADDGGPIPEAILARIGDPFFSTKAGGTGLGVTFARRILAAHRGRLTIANAGSAGAIVRLELPA